ncbi:MAG TPA: VWA domain-containing protein [Terracidiphilus sp.]|nr:VWA domain-containing protein [Terracidiphilus sp.]
MRLVSFLIPGFLSCSAAVAVAQTAVTAAPSQSSPALAAHPANESSAPATEGSMRLNVVVTDKGGRAVPGLGVGDFQLLDNNRPMQIVSFQAYGANSTASAPPAMVVIVFDTVNMPFESVSYTRQQVAAFLRQNGGHLPYPVSLAFLTNANMDIQNAPTTDGNELAKHLDDSATSLRTITNAAGAWGDIERFQFCTRMLTVLAEHIKDLPGRKLVIWAGPGWPMLSNPNMEFSLKGQKAFFDSVVQLNTLMREGQIELSSVAQGMPGPETFMYESFLKGVKKPTQAIPGNLALKVIATQSGGRVIPPSNDLTSSLGTVVQDAGTYYQITFSPPPPDGPNEYHELKLKVNQAGLTAHTNAGYYGKPQQVGQP